MFLNELKMGEEKTKELPIDLRVLSLGAGVQSSTVLFKIINQEIKPVDVVIFADTGNEPESVYEWLEYLEKKMKENNIRFEKVRSSENTGNIIKDYQAESGRHGLIPLHIKRKTGTHGISKRTCTFEYKIRPLQQWIREYLDVVYLRSKHIEMVMGISYDEITRVRNTKDQWQVNCYPLVENKITRQDCIDYMESRNLGTPPRSACIICPYRTASEWKYLHDTNKKEYEFAVNFDEWLRNDEYGVGKETFRKHNATSDPYIHYNRKPLKEVDFAEVDPLYNLLDDECEGMCGV